MECCVVQYAVWCGGAAYWIAGCVLLARWLSYRTSRTASSHANASHSSVLTSHSDVRSTMASMLYVKTTYNVQHKDIYCNFY